MTIEDPHKPPPGFGGYPGMHRKVQMLHEHRPRHMDAEQWFQRILGQKASLSEFQNPLHPGVYLIPRSKHLQLYYDEHFDEIVGIDQFPGFFSSYDFHINWDYGVFQECAGQLFMRQAEIFQLGFLVPPYPDAGEVLYAPPTYTHARAWHVLIAGAFADVILARAGFSEKERAPFVLAVLYHDCALPAGGDSVKRIDLNALDEEANFAEVVRQHGLQKIWKQRYGFNLKQAAMWVRNEGMLGKLLDVVDKMSYVMLDCYYIGLSYDGMIRRHCQANPLFMDVWQDIRFLADRSAFAFTHPDRLYQFLLARAYEHTELLLNPQARVVDFDFTNLVRPLYASGELTKAELLRMNSWHLQGFLAKRHPQNRVTQALISPQRYGWQRFDSEESMRVFVKGLPPDVMLTTEHITGFTTGLDWPVFADASCSRIVPLQKRLTTAKIRHLESVHDSVVGFYAYWYTERPR